MGLGLGEDDQLGNLNELSPELTLKALSKVKDGKVYDLGLAYDRRSYKFVGHSSGEIMSFRTPEGLPLNPGDKELAFVEEDNSLNTTWASNALFISDTVPPRSTRSATSTRETRPTPTTATARRTSRAISGS